MVRFHGLEQQLREQPVQRPLELERAGFLLVLFVQLVH
jgi:hypothetical protein